jgi:hypothetical protein
MNERVFDTILFEENDVVIRKNKALDHNGKEPTAERVYKTVQVNSGTGYIYQILYFYSNPNSPFVAFEFEPFDAKQKKEYYDILKQVNKDVKPKVKKQAKYEEPLIIKAFNKK